MSGLTVIQIKDVHDWVQRHSVWTADRVQYGKIEDWRVPAPDANDIYHDDCDGLALLRCDKLKYVNCYPAVCQTETYDWRNRNVDGYNHAVAIAECEGEFWCMDNRHPEAMPLRYFRHYPIFYRPTNPRDITGKWAPFDAASAGHFDAGP